MSDKKPEWKAPPHYVLVKEGIVLADSVDRFAVSHGNLYKLNYADPSYQKWAADRAVKKKAIREKRIKRVKDVAERKATRLALREMRAAKRAKTKELNTQIKALRNAKKKL